VVANPYKPRPIASSLRAPNTVTDASSSSTRSLTPGSVVLGRYTIQKVIGRGGMATVYLARNQETERLVALKILDPEISNDPSYVERFRREARAAGRIRSDHVVAIYDLGTDQSGTLVLVMEYLEGQTVQQALRNGRMPLQRAMILARQLCEGLAAAHENGVIHRDLKPANLFIEKLTGGNEKLKILDFGISKLAEASSQELTRAGQTLGTLAYMAPEQIRGTVKGNDPRIDLYSAGVSMFLMLTAKRPIDAEDTVQLLQAVLEKPALTLGQATGTEFPPALEAFIDKSLRKDPTQRYQTALEMRDALLSAANAAGVDAIAHFSSPFPRASAPPSVPTPSSPMVGGTPSSGVVSTVVEAAPSFTPPSGVIVSSGNTGPAPQAGLTLPTFEDEEEEGKTVVRAPSFSNMQGGPSEASVLPAAGQRIGNAPPPFAPPQPQAAPHGSVMRAPTLPPKGLAGAPHQHIPGMIPNAPPSGGVPMTTMPPLNHQRTGTLVGSPPGPNDMGAFGMPPGMDANGGAPPTQALDIFPGAQDAFGPPPPQAMLQPAPGMPNSAAMSSLRQPTTMLPAAAPMKKRSSSTVLLVAASVVSLVLVSVAGFVAVNNRQQQPAPRHNIVVPSRPPAEASIAQRNAPPANTEQAANPTPTAPPQAQTLTDPPVAQPLQQPVQQPVQQALLPTPGTPDTAQGTTPATNTAQTEPPTTPDAQQPEAPTPRSGRHSRSSHASQTTHAETPARTQTPQRTTQTAQHTTPVRTTTTTRTATTNPPAGTGTTTTGRGRGRRGSTLISDVPLF
jgi:serine/threonine-protein kinase